MGDGIATEIDVSGTTGIFTANAGGLAFATSYSFVAFATSRAGAGYTSPVATFTTLPVAPFLTSPTSTSVTSNTAVLGADVTGDGGAAIIERGVLVAPTALDSNPTLGDGVATKFDAGGTTGVLNTKATGLAFATGYSYVAFATNSVGTTPVQSLSDLHYAACCTILECADTASITSNSATLGGNVTGNGGAAVTMRGILVAPTALDSHPSLGDGVATEIDVSGTTGVFTANVGGLAFATSYSFVAFATNSAGVGYFSPAATFTTLPVAPFLSYPTSTSVTSSTALLGGDVRNDGRAAITERSPGRSNRARQQSRLWATALQPRSTSAGLLVSCYERNEFGLRHGLFFHSLRYQQRRHDLYQSGGDLHHVACCTILECADFRIHHLEQRNVGAATSPEQRRRPRLPSEESWWRRLRLG